MPQQKLPKFDPKSETRQRMQFARLRTALNNDEGLEEVLAENQREVGSTNAEVFGRLEEFDVSSLTRLRDEKLQAAEVRRSLEAERVNSKIALEKADRSDAQLRLTRRVCVAFLFIALALGTHDYLAVTSLKEDTRNVRSELERTQKSEEQKREKIVKESAGRLANANAELNQVKEELASQSGKQDEINKKLEMYEAAQGAKSNVGNIVDSCLVFTNTVPRGPGATTPPPYIVWAHKFANGDELRRNLLDDSFRTRILEKVDWATKHPRIAQALAAGSKCEVFVYGNNSIEILNGIDLRRFKLDVARRVAYPNPRANLERPSDFDIPLLEHFTPEQFILGIYWPMNQQ